MLNTVLSVRNTVKVVAIILTQVDRPRSEFLQDAGLYTFPVVPKELGIVLCTWECGQTQEDPHSLSPDFAKPSAPKLPRKPHLYSTAAALEAAVDSEEDTPTASSGERSSGGGCSLERIRKEGLGCWPRAKG